MNMKRATVGMKAYVDPFNLNASLQLAEQPFIEIRYRKCAQLNIVRVALSKTALNDIHDGKLDGLLNSPQKGYDLFKHLAKQYKCYAEDAIDFDGTLLPAKETRIGRGEDENGNTIWGVTTIKRTYMENGKITKEENCCDTPSRSGEQTAPEHVLALAG